MYTLIGLDVDISPAVIFGLSLLGTVLPAWIILR
jgi:hypothetical protein